MNNDKQSISKTFADMVDQIDFCVSDTYTQEMLHFDYIDISESNGRLICKINVSKAYSDMNAKPTATDSDYIFEKLMSSKFAKYREKGFITKRELFSKLRGNRFKKVSDMEYGLNQLVQYQRIEILDITKKEAGRPSTIIRILKEE